MNEFGSTGFMSESGTHHPQGGPGPMPNKSNPSKSCIKRHICMRSECSNKCDSLRSSGASGPACKGLKAGGGSAFGQFHRPIGAFQDDV